VATTYEKLISSSTIDVITPQVPDGFYSAWAQYSVLAEDQTARQAILDRLKLAGVPTMIYYERPLHMQKAFANLNYQAGDFPVSEQASNRIFSLPMHPYLDDKSIAFIVEAMA